MGESDLFLVIIAGGSGTRFWPKSTVKRPKQLLGFGSAQDGSPLPTLLTQTLDRFDGLVPHHQRMIVTTEALHPTVAQEVPPDMTILAEPQARNTAPCVYWAAQMVFQQNPKGILLVMPADHYIAEKNLFIASAQRACQWARGKSDLVTLGIQPTRPETGYGYLKIGEALSGGAYQVQAFVEKPNLEKAQEFFHSRSYLWNGGMFIWRADVILEAFDQTMPEMRQAWNSARGNITQAYPKMTATSIDYGVMEKSKNVVTFPLDCGWDDLGSWISLENMADVLNARHAAGTVIAGEVITVRATGNIIDTPGKVVTLLGVQDLIVVEHQNTILVADKNEAQDIRLIVEQIKKLKPELA